MAAFARIKRPSVEYNDLVSILTLPGFQYLEFEYSPGHYCQSWRVTSHSYAWWECDGYSGYRNFSWEKEARKPVLTKRKRGRPRKNAVPDAIAVQEPEAADEWQGIWQFLKGAIFEEGDKTIEAAIEKGWIRDIEISIK